MVFCSVPCDEEDTFLNSGRRNSEKKENGVTRKRSRILGKKRNLRIRKDRSRNEVMKNGTIIMNEVGK
jgi:hypothetical protein